MGFVPARSPHGSIINRVARAALTPLSLRRKGQSRFWHDDYGWRAFLVEFQPSSWSKGTYCNVGAMWLWDPNVPPRWVFHIGRRTEPPEGQFVSYEGDPTQFEERVAMMATEAAAEIVRLRDGFTSVESVAFHYGDQPQIGWPGYHGGVALGLMGHVKQAAACFSAVAADAANSEIEWIAQLGRGASQLAGLVADSEAFLSVIEGQIARTREGLGLASLPHPLSLSVRAR